MSLSVEQNDLVWMQQALVLADEAQLKGEVPVGAIAVYQGKILAKAYNQPITLCDPCAHAEILVLRRAAQELANYRLLGITIYATLEPCAMCAMAMVHARIKRLVYGASDPKTGAAGSKLNIFTPGQFNHDIQVTNGILATESSERLQAFFKSRR